MSPEIDPEETATLAVLAELGGARRQFEPRRLAAGNLLQRRQERDLDAKLACHGTGIMPAITVRCAVASARRSR